MLARISILAAVALPLAACGVTGNFRNDPGYADFGALQQLHTDSDFGISLGPLPLRVAGWFIDEDDAEELGPLLRELRAVRVYTFEGIHDTEDLASGVKELAAELTGDGWLNVIAVREDDELMSVFLRPGKDFAHRGLAVIVQEPDEVVLVNLIGNIRLDFFNGYMAEAGVDVPPIEIDPATLQARAITRPEGPATGIDP
jgi:hypothetical protein